MNDLSTSGLILLCLAGLVVGYIIAVILDSDSYANLKKRIRRKLATIHLSEKRYEIFCRDLDINHVEYRLLKEYNVRTLYEVYKESGINADFDEVLVMLFDCDTNEMVWNKLTRQLDVFPVIRDVLEQLDKSDRIYWNMIW